MTYCLCRDKHIFVNVHIEPSPSVLLVAVSLVLDKWPVTERHKADNAEIEMSFTISSKSDTHRTHIKHSSCAWKPWNRNGSLENYCWETYNTYTHTQIGCIVWLYIVIEDICALCDQTSGIPKFTGWSRLVLVGALGAFVMLLKKYNKSKKPTHHKYGMRFVCYGRNFCARRITIKYSAY